MSTQTNPSVVERPVFTGQTEVKHEAGLDHVAAAFGLSAAITIVFNTALAWIKDAYDPLNNFMAALTGHHWRTHGIVDVIVFFALGLFFMRSHAVEHLTDRLIVSLAAAVVIGGGGLAAWFLLV